MGSFQDVSSEVEFGAQEHGVIALWKTLNAFQRSVDQRAGASAFIFYDGPPFATGLPHYGHLVASTLKDIVPRYWTMRGFRVERRFGWDTHGLPIEMQVEKALGLSGPHSVREYGVAKFNEACRGSVLTYVEEWRRTVTRVGRWVDFDRDYKTMDRSFMESVWWVFAELWKKGLVYEGRRVMPYSWRLSTPLSNFEAGLDYRDVDDPALTVRLALDEPLAGKPASLLIWTTTPWTLPSNLAVAVSADLAYVVADGEDGQRYVVAKDLLVATLGEKAAVVAELTGKDLVGKTYAPLFPFFADRKAKGAFRVIHSGHVTTTDGTGLVHMAPAFGEDDFVACQKHGIEVVDPVDAEGNFGPEVPPYQGRNVKEADKAIIHDLKARGAVFKHSQLRHPYPYCYRSGTPLIYKTTPSWYVKVEPLRERMVANNQSIHWVPGFVGEKRFENWLKEARDWSISRSRFWGTPIPLWQSDDGKDLHCVGSVAELEQLTGARVDDLHPHRIDHHTFVKDGKTYRRIADVFDCWFESGSMPYAQVHYPFENKVAFEGAFPAQFIAEGLDQTRGWFYTLLVLSTALFDRAPFKNVIVNGLVLAEDGSKMSKSKKNYPDPNDVIERHGADALRAYLINSPLVRAEPLRFSEAGVKEVVRTVLLPLQNAWSFFTTYANVDGWDPKTDLAKAPPVARRPELDRWILSVLQSLVGDINAQMEGYYLDRVVPPMLGFIDDLTNWYIRRSRRRFWKSEDSADKAAAYATLYEVLTTFAKVVAPVLPFFAERLHQHLVVQPGLSKPTEDSVHLCDYPLVNDALIDRHVEQAMAAVRQTVTLGRALREKHKLKTRQPLQTLTVVSTNEAVRRALTAHAELLEDELNVKQVVALADDASLATLTFKPNLKTLGKRLGKRLKDAAADIAAFTRAQWAVLEGGGSVTVQGEALTKDDVLVARTAKGEVVVESSGDLTVALDTKVTDGLRREGLMRELVSRVQKLRKDGGLAVADRIVLTVATTDADVRACCAEHEARIKDEVLATRLEVVPAGEGESMDVDGHAVTVQVMKG
ncbi:MAG: isoleucine--tRNA ligase [Myxococcaceae bacterium]|jgi:isoleucyl-tRNA synthetase|nr:isoleucine--tRNA ligase [Myxococcaceae bacterium]MCA3016360.1 isoleucine--tRNA ligase [Myxococcaceae bacterium]